MERMVIALESIAESLKKNEQKPLPIGNVRPDGKARQFEIKRLMCGSCKAFTDHEVTASWIHCTYCGLLSTPWPGDE